MLLRVEIVFQCYAGYTYINHNIFLHMLFQLYLHWRITVFSYIEKLHEII